MNTDVYYSGRGKSPLRFNEMVVAEMVSAPDSQRVGRLVQVRKGAGPFKSDTFMIRDASGSLRAFGNVLLRSAADKDFERAFYTSNDRTPPVIPAASEIPEEESGIEYMIGNEWPETGFIINESSQPEHPQQSFAMMVVTKQGGHQMTTPTHTIAEYLSGEHDEELRVLVAETTGKFPMQVTSGENGCYKTWCYTKHKDNGMLFNLPKYSTSRGDCEELLADLSEPEWRTFLESICLILSGFRELTNSFQGIREIFSATPRQICIAYLLTKGVLYE